MLWATAYQIASMLKVRVVLLLPEDGSIAVKAGYPPEDMLDEADLAAAKWAWENDRPAGRGSDTLPGAKRLFLPMRTGRGAIGVVGIDSDKPGPLLTPDERRLLDALIDQGALAIERVHLVEDIDRAKRTVGDRAAALGAADLDLARPQDAARRRARRRRAPCAIFGGKLTDAEKADLLATDHRRIRAAQPLHRQPARHDEARIRRDRAERRAARSRRDRRQRAAARRQDPGAAPRRAGARAGPADARARRRPVRAGAVQPPRQRREICAAGTDRSASRAGATSDSVCLQVLDEGDGIPPADLEHIFDKFYRAQKGDQVRAGTGLGLAISRGFVEAMHGTITAANRTDRSGAVFTIRLPVPGGRPQQLDTAA